MPVVPYLLFLYPVGTVPHVEELTSSKSLVSISIVMWRLMQGRTYAEKSGRWSVSCIIDTFANLLEFWRFSGFQILRERAHSFVEEESSHSFASSSDHALDRREITSQSIEEKGIATIRLDLEPRLQIKSKADSRAQQTIAHNKAKMPSFALLSKKAALEIQAPLKIETFVCFE